MASYGSVSTKFFASACVLKLIRISVRVLVVTTTLSTSPASLAREWTAANDDSQSFSVLQLLRTAITENTVVPSRFPGGTPEGPVFVHGLLELMFDKLTRSWTPTDNRDPLFQILREATDNKTGSWDNFQAHPLRAEIQTQLRQTIARFPSGGQRQAKVLSIYAKLELWDVDDIQLIAKEIVNRTENENLPLLLMQLLPQASFEVQTAVAESFRQSRSISGLGVSFLLGLLAPAEIESVLRYRLDQAAGKPMAKRDKVLYPFVDQKFADLLRVNDPVVTRLYHQYRLNPNWAGRNLQDHEEQDMLAHLRKLWTLQKFVRPAAGSRSEKVVLKPAWACEVGLK